MVQATIWYFSRWNVILKYRLKFFKGFLITKNAKLIIWEEACVLHKRCFEALDRALKRQQLQCSNVMGDITAVLSGDFGQTLPVITRGTRTNQVNPCSKSSYRWCVVKNLKIFYKHVFVIQSNPHSTIYKFAKKHLDIGNGFYKPIGMVK